MNHRPIDLQPPSKIPPVLTVLAVMIFLANTIVATASTGRPQAVADPSVLSVRDECQLALGYPARTADDIAWLTTCVHALTPPTTPPTPSSPPTTTTPAPTTPPITTTPPTTTPPTTTTPPAPGQCAPFPAFPDASCTGWKHTGVTLHPCGDPAGSATHLEVANAVYDSCVFADSVVIQAANITIKRSWVKGTVYPNSERMRTPDGFPDYKGVKLIDVEVGPSSDPDRAGVGNGFHKSLLRVDVHGTASGIHVSDFNDIRDSYSHDFADTGSHGAAAGTGQDMGNHSVIIHNNLNCSRTNGAAHCSAALALYDEPTLTDVLVQQNLFNSVSGFCAYGGNTGTFIRFVDNVFGQRYSPTCGPFGPITVFFFNTGNVWSGNKYANGQVVNP